MKHKFLITGLATATLLSTAALTQLSPSVYAKETTPKTAAELKKEADAKVKELEAKADEAKAKADEAAKAAEKEKKEATDAETAKAEADKARVKAEEELASAKQAAEEAAAKVKEEETAKEEAAKKEEEAKKEFLDNYEKALAAAVAKLEEAEANTPDEIAAKKAIIAKVKEEAEANKAEIEEAFKNGATAAEAEKFLKEAGKKPADAGTEITNKKFTPEETEKIEEAKKAEAARPASEKAQEKADDLAEKAEKLKKQADADAKTAAEKEAALEKTNAVLKETKEAVEHLDSILTLPGIDEVHIGLNDLHLAYHLDFMFEPLVNGLVENICLKLKEANLPFGFGGIARIGEGTLPAEKILMEHYRLGSSRVILSRTFCNIDKINDLGKLEPEFIENVLKIREFEHSLLETNSVVFEANRKEVAQQVAMIVKEKREGSL